MPVNLSRDKLGTFARWGKMGKKYYYIPNNKVSRESAKLKALKQGRAIWVSRR